MLLKMSLFYVLTLSFLFFRPTLSTVLGIDLGTELIKVAAVAPGRSFEIVLDESSKRSHPPLIIFDDDVRHYGNSASSLAIRRPLKALQQFTRLLGKPANGSEILAEMTKTYVFQKLLKDNVRGVFRYESPYLELVSDNDDVSAKNKEEKGYILTAKSYSVEEITAMKLQHIKNLAQKSSGADIVGCILTVPHFWTYKERRALLDASQLAGLNAFGLINENTAAAVQYAITMDYQPNTNDVYIFYNMGATSTQVSVIRFFSQEKKSSKHSKQTKLSVAFEVLGQGWDETLGGSKFDLFIIELLLDKVKEVLKKNKVDPSVISTITTNPRIMTRLKFEAQKAKKVLSANKETVVTIEGLHADIDFQHAISRQQLYTTAQSLFDRVLPPIDFSLAQAKLSKEQIEGIVLLGGGTRIPRVRELLADYLKNKPLKENLNADEAPAMGAAFRAANLSSAFRVREIGMEDITSFPIGVRLKNLNPSNAKEQQFSKRGNLFLMNNRLHRRRTVTLTHAHDLHVSVFYEEEANLPLDTSEDLGWYEVTGLTTSVKKFASEFSITAPPKVILSFVLDASGLIDLVQANAIFTEVNRNTGKNTEEKSQSGSGEERKHQVILNVIKHPPEDVKWYDSESFEKSRKVLMELDDKDKAVHDISQAYNELETYIFESRNTLYSNKYVEKISSQEQRKNFGDALAKAEQWIREVKERSVKVFQNKLEQLKELGGSVFQKAYELEHRPIAIETAGKTIHKLYETVEMLKKDRTWMPTEEIQKLYDSTKGLEEWLNNKIELQSELPPAAEPVLSVQDIENRLAVVMEMAQRLVDKRPPQKTADAKTTTNKKETEKPNIRKSSEENRKKDSEASEKNDL